MAGEAGERATGGQRAQRAGVEPGARGEVLGVGEGAFAARGDDAGGGVVAEAADHAQAEAHRGLRAHRRRVRLRCAGAARQLGVCWQWGTGRWLR